MNLLFVTFLVLLPLARGGLNCKKSPCASSRIKKFLAADCYKRDLSGVPQCLRSGVEIIDLSYNRIRKLMKDDLNTYSSLKILYLSDNMIVDIHDDVFLGLNSLSVLDLSLNGIAELPPKIFNLPSLSKLFLSQNQNMNIIDAVELAKPISAPLITLDISFNELESLPDFGLMVDLMEYNISGNNLKQVTPSDFAGMCNLKYLHSDNMTVEFENDCDCVTINQWLNERQVKFKPFLCNSNGDKCDGAVSKPDLVLFESCKVSHEQLIIKNKLLKYLLPCLAVLVLVICAVIFYFLRKRRRINSGLGKNNSNVLRLKEEEVDKTLLK